MKLYKLFKFNQFINESKQTNDEIDLICKRYDIINYTINEDGTVDTGDVNLDYKGLTKLPLRFGKVSGYFDCDNNQLTSLEGSPSEVGGDFYCSYNQLTSLEGCPQEVGGSFNCDNNQLTSLEGCPSEVGGKFNCYQNQLTSLEGSPSEVGGYFSCHSNKLRDVKGFPRIIKGEIFIRFNPFDEIFNLFPYDRWLEVAEYLNEYDVIRDGNKVVMQALEVVYDELGLEVPENIKIKGYEII